MPYTFKTTALRCLIVFVACSICLNVGFWELNKSTLKTLLQQQYAKRQHYRITVDSLSNQQDLRFYNIQLYGKFDNTHSVLIRINPATSQKTQAKTYQLYTPFDIFGSKKMIWVDRGLSNTPEIEPIFGKRTIQGILNHVPSALGVTLKEPLQRPFFSYLVVMRSAVGGYYIPGMVTEKHEIYAYQFFVLAGFILILFVFFSTKKKIL